MLEFILPEKWYVLYSNREEFDIINKYYNKNWGFSSSSNENGYSNININNNWIDNNINNPINISNLKKLNAVQLSFEKFTEYVIGKKYIQDHKYLIEFLNKLNIK